MIAICDAGTGTFCHKEKLIQTERVYATTSSRTSLPPDECPSIGRGITRGSASTTERLINADSLAVHWESGSSRAALGIQTGTRPRGTSKTNTSSNSRISSSLITTVVSEAPHHVGNVEAAPILYDLRLFTNSVAQVHCCLLFPRLNVSRMIIHSCGERE